MDLDAQAFIPPLQDECRRGALSHMSDDVRDEFCHQQLRLFGHRRHAPSGKLRDGGSAEQTNFRRLRLKRQDTTESGFGDLAA
ncbi:hypothetical protein GCM10010304_18110 [Streptomyces roseoviolaceus]